MIWLYRLGLVSLWLLTVWWLLAVLIGWALDWATKRRR